ncbi:MAG: hypothetical protein QF903_10075, partial [Planctomycetota bacterium]|nr:hypothetical protein [Planctomycetota bacterium]
MRPFALACAAGTLSLFATAAQAQVKPGIMERFGPRSERVRAERDRPGRRAAPQAEEAVRGRLLQLIERHDLDKDGKLNGQEAAAAREAWARLRGARVGSKPERGVGGARKGGDGAGKDARNPQARKKQDGVKRPKAGSPLHQALLERFDADGDGRLDGAEATKARAHWARVRKAQGPGGGIDRGNEERVRGD